MLRRSLVFSGLLTWALISVTFFTVVFNVSPLSGIVHGSATRDDSATVTDRFLAKEIPELHGVYDVYAGKTLGVTGGATVTVPLLTELTAGVTGGEVAIPVDVLDAPSGDLGAYQFKLSYDSAVVTLGVTGTAVQGGDFPFDGVTAVNITTPVTGNEFVEWNHFQGGSVGVPSLITVANVTFEPVGAAGECTDLDLTVVELVDNDSVPITNSAQDGQICLVAIDAEAVTDLVAAQDVDDVLLPTGVKPVITLIRDALSEVTLPDRKIKSYEANINVTPLVSVPVGSPLPTSLYLSGISLPGIVDAVTNVFTTALGLKAKDVYGWRGKAYNFDASTLKAAAPVQDPRYFQLPADLPPRIRALAVQVTADAASPYEKAKALEIFLKTEYTYAFVQDDPTYVPMPAGRDPVDWFLFDHPVGTCGNFSSSFVLMARSIGLPSRIVTGWAIAPIAEEQIVNTGQAHQWAEVAFEGLGWIRFEPTAAGGAPDRVPQAASSADDDEFKDDFDRSGTEDTPAGDSGTPPVPPRLEETITVITSMSSSRVLKGTQVLGLMPSQLI